MVNINVNFDLASIENIAQHSMALLTILIAVVGILQIPYIASIWVQLPIGRIPSVLEGYLNLFLTLMIWIASSLTQLLLRNDSGENNSVDSEGENQSNGEKAPKEKREKEKDLE